MSKQSTACTSFVGTFNYMSPERLTGEVRVQYPEQTRNHAPAHASTPSILPSPYAHAHTAFVGVLIQL